LQSKVPLRLFLGFLGKDFARTSYLTFPQIRYGDATLVVIDQYLRALHFAIKVPFPLYLAFNCRDYPEIL
jgi:hypothetical protein